MMMNGDTNESFTSQSDVSHNSKSREREENSKTTAVSNLVQQLDFLSSPLSNAAVTSPANRDVPSDVPAIDDDTAVVDETPYEHNFAPGDHIIRWDMLPIFWPIQIHGIVLSVSEDKSEVIICDFGMTSVKGGEDEDKKPTQSLNKSDSHSMKKLEEDNVIFTNAIHSEPLYVSNAEQLMMLDGLTTTIEQSTKKKKKANENQRLNVITLRKWSDLRKWSKENYEGGLLSGNGGIGKGLETLGKQTEKGLAASKEGLENLGKHTGKGLEHLGKQTEKLWLSMKPLFAGDGVEKKGGGTKAYRTIRNEVDDMGRCLYHNEIQIKEQTDDGSWVAIRKKCPKCIKEDCPVMLGEDTSTGQTPLLDQVSNLSSGEGKHSHTVAEVSRAKIEGTNVEVPIHSVKLEELPTSNNAGNDAKIFTFDDTITTGVVAEEVDSSKSLSQMIEEANEIDRQSRHHQSPERKPTTVKEKSYYGSFMNSLKDIGNFTKSSTKLPSTVSNSGEIKHNATNSTNGAKATPTKAIARCDPPLLVLARTRFILEHGESILPPYHILNANSECIAVWCKTGRWSTFQASVYLHSSAIGYGKSTIGLSIAAAATQPWLIPAFATMGVAAIGTPWVLLKIANERWNEATNNLTEKFWAQAENEVIVECIRQWSSIECDESKSAEIDHI